MQRDETLSRAEDGGEKDGSLDSTPQVPSTAYLNIHLLNHFTQRQESQGTSLFLKFSQPERFRAW